MSSTYDETPVFDDSMGDDVENDFGDDDNWSMGQDTGPVDAVTQPAPPAPAPVLPKPPVELPAPVPPTPATGRLVRRDAPRGRRAPGGGGFKRMIGYTLVFALGATLGYIFRSNKKD